MTDMFSVTLRLRVTGPDRADHFQHVTDCYYKLEAGHAELLDCAWSLSNEAEHAHVDVEITVRASDKSAAYELARSAARSAIHDAGGFTPDWDDKEPDLSAVEYRLADDSEVVPV